MTENYRDRAGAAVAHKFIGQVDDAVRFIVLHPLACAVYTELDGHEFRKWSLGGFPVSVFFRREEDATIILEALYAHRMNIDVRLHDDLTSRE